MNISKIQNNIFNSTYVTQTHTPYFAGKTLFKKTENDTFVKKEEELGNIKRAKKLFPRHLPCIYCGKPTINPKKIFALEALGIFEGPSVKFVDETYNERECLHDVQRDVYNKIVSISKIHPQMNIKQILEKIEPNHRKQLIQEQENVLNKLYNISSQLPERHKQKVNYIIDRQDCILNGRLITIPFDRQEFCQKLEEICENTNDKKLVKTLMEASKHFPDERKKNLSEKTLQDNQAGVINKLKNIIDKQKPDNYEELINLLEEHNKYVHHLPIEVTFKKDDFYKNLNDALLDLNDKKIRALIVDTAKELPSSHANVSKFIVKYAKKSSTEIGLALLNPSAASIEHLQAQLAFRNDDYEKTDDYANLANACTSHNISRGHTDFRKFVRENPFKLNINESTQAYFDSLIKILKEENCYARYSFTEKDVVAKKKTIEKLSKGLIKIDISELDSTE